jgi:hypothetical protein
MLALWLFRSWQAATPIEEKWVLKADRRPPLPVLICLQSEANAKAGRMWPKCELANWGAKQLATKESGH